MKIAVIQPDTVWESKKENFRRLEQQILDTESDTELIILPEMFNTGFSINPSGLGESPHSETFEWMSGIADSRKAAICGSYIVRIRNNFYNRWVFTAPGTKYRSYDKRHLFSPTRENLYFTHGNKPVIFKFREFRIFPTICYDLRFPVWSRNTRNYDLLINSANWPHARRDVWITLLKARAIENQCYVAGANRVGTDGNGYFYSGESMIIDPKGRIIASGSEKDECIISADISLKELKDFRKKFPVLRDADKFFLYP
jgi:predicted amidohydrolase